MSASLRVPAWRWLLLSRRHKLFGAGLHSPVTVLPEENNPFYKNAATVMKLIVEIYPQTLLFVFLALVHLCNKQLNIMFESLHESL